MPIAVHCPECQVLFHVGDEFAGRPGRCPECGAVLRVPGPDPEPGPPPDPDPYRTRRPIEAHDDPYPSRRRDSEPDREQQLRDDFDERRPRDRRFDPQVRATAWERVRKGLWYVQVAVILYAFSQVFQTGFMMTRGMKEADPANLDSGMVAVGCGSLVVMLAVAVFWLLGRFACLTVPYVPARGWAKASLGMGVTAIFLFVAFFCLFIMAIGAAAQGPNPGAIGILMIAVLTLFAVAAVVLGGEAAALMSMIQIGKGLKDTGAAGWSKACLGLMVVLLAVGTVGFCGFAVYLGDKKQKEQAAKNQAPAANNGAPAPAADKGKMKGKDKDTPPVPPQVNPPQVNPPPQPDPFEPEPMDETTQIVFNAVLLGMIFLYLIVFSIALQKTRAAIRREVRVLTGEADKDPWDADHRY